MEIGYDYIVFGMDRDKRSQLPQNRKSEAITMACVFYDDKTSEVIEFNSGDEVKEFLNELKESGVDQKNLVTYHTDSATFNKFYKKAMKGESSKNYKGALLTAGIIAGAIGVGALGATIASRASDKDVEPEAITNDNEDEQGYGYYNFDLSKVGSFEDYLSQVPDSEQKEAATLYLNTLKDFNREITLVDTTTVLDVNWLGGLTLEQLIAVDAYANSNLYSKEDYVERFGLYDFTGNSSNFQQAVLTTSALFADPSVDGKALVDIFQDEVVKTSYLKQLEYRDSILNAEDKKAQKKAVKEYLEYLADSMDASKEEYIDYSEHPGMAFVTPVIVNALNYHNIELDSDLVTDMLIIGTDETQSKLDSICSAANEKIDSVIEFVNDLESTVLANNQILKLQNKQLQADAEKNGTTPMLLTLSYAEIDQAISEKLCDQNQVNMLINIELSQIDKLVTETKQKRIIANAVKISAKTDERKYVNSTVAELSQQLQEKGDTATITQEDVKIDTPEEKQELINSNPVEVQEAVNDYNNEHGTLPYETPEQQESTDQEIQWDVNDNYNEGVKFVNQVISYYETHGNVSGIPAELQVAYNNLGSTNYNIAKNTGVSRWEVANNKYSGGEVTTNSEYSDVDTSATKDSNVYVESTTSTPPTVEENTNDTVVEENTNDTPVVEENNNQTGNTTGGETNIIEGFEDYDIGDISTSPTSDAATYSVPSESAEGVVTASETYQPTEEEIEAYINSLAESGELSDLVVSSGDAALDSGYSK